MQIVYNSRHYHVVEYPESEGFEVINKPAGLGTYLCGPVATAFRDNFARIVASGPNIETVDEFLGGFDALMNQPAVLH